MTDRQIYHPVILIILGLVFFFPFLGNVHLFDWDEINFAESAREMLVTGDFLRVHIDFEPFTEKPPLFFWLQAVCMHFFGVSEFAARLPNAITGIIVLLVLYYTGKKLNSPRFGMMWALVFWGSFLPHIYFRSGIIDPVFNLFMFLSILYLALSVSSENRRQSIFNAMYSGIFTGLAVLTKGPVGFLIVFLCFLVYWAYRKFRNITGMRQISVYAAAVLIVSFAWYGIETLRNGPHFLSGFIIRQIEIFTTSDAGHGQPFYYHFIVLLIGCFPASPLALSNLRYAHSATTDPFSNFRTWMIAALIVVLTVFSISTTKIVHYSSMAYYPITFLAAHEIYKWTSGTVEIKKWVMYLLTVLAFLLGMILISVGILSRNIHVFTSSVKDPFVQSILTTEVHWGGQEWIVGFIFITTVVTGLIFLKRKLIMPSLTALFSGTAITILLFAALILPKIEQYTQGPYIRFFKSLEGRDVYVGTIGFKSYAHLYYADKQPHQPRQMSFNELVETELNVPVYLAVKITNKHRLDPYPEFKMVRQEGGFLFYMKSALIQNE